MANRLKKFTLPSRKPARKNLSNEFFYRMGGLHFELGVPLECGPCFEHSVQSLAWQKGWLLKEAYYAGHEAGTNGKTRDDNPYRENLARTGCGFLLVALFIEWVRGHDAARFTFRSQ